MVEAIFFDIDGTLYDSDRNASTARLHAVEAMIEKGLLKHQAGRSTPEQVYHSLCEIVKKYGSNYSRHFDKLVERFDRERRFSEGEIELIVSAGVVEYHKIAATLRPFPELKSTLARLRERAVLGIISDGLTRKQFQKIVMLGVDDYFSPELIFVSQGVARRLGKAMSSVNKPSTVMFELARKALGARRERLVYVGNSPGDVIGANDAGWISVLYARDHSGEDSRFSGRAKPKVVIGSLSELKEKF